MIKKNIILSYLLRFRLQKFYFYIHRFRIYTTVNMEFYGQFSLKRSRMGWEEKEKLPGRGHTWADLLPLITQKGIE